MIFSCLCVVRFCSVGKAGSEGMCYGFLVVVGIILSMTFNINCSRKK